MVTKKSILPVEIIEFEILTRLPVKSLLRFKSVCKSWNLLFSSHDFIKSVRNSNHNSLTLICMQKFISGTDSIWYCQKLTDIIGCINGLVCFYDSYENYRITIFKIWNPATKHCLEIKPPSEVFIIQMDQMYCYHSFGFGFDSVANDFKIMHVELKEKQPLAGYVYSCNGGCWSKITPSNFLYHSIQRYSRPFIFNGSPFWLITQTLNGKESLTVISFDVREEVFRLLPDLGSFEKKSYGKYDLLNFRDSLAVMFHGATLFFGVEPIEIYTFNERCNDWSKMSIGPFQFWSREPIALMEPWFVGYFNSGHILFLCPLKRKKYCIDLQNCTIKSIGGKEGDLCKDIWYGFTNYSESLVSIDGMKPSSGTGNEVRYYYPKSRSDSYAYS